MPRPSLKEERKKQIILAVQECVAAHGIAGMTIEKVAEIAGLARPLIRHNVGNREDLINALVEQYLYDSKLVMKELMSSLPNKDPLPFAIDLLFDAERSNTQLVLIGEALIAEGANNIDLANKMKKWLDDFVQGIGEIVRLQYPESSKELAYDTAVGITGIYFSVDSMSPLGSLPKFRKASKRSALRLAGLAGSSST